MTKSLFEIYGKYCGSEENLYYSLGRNEYLRRSSTPEGISAMKITHGTDKGTSHNYLPIYEKYMTKTSDINFLEIGVAEGYSMKMWNEYFDNSNIYGCDHDISQMHFHVNNVFEIDSTNDNQIKGIFNNIEFDYIVDDGDHKVSTQIKTLDCLWPYLKNNGVYFIEDIENSDSLSQIVDHAKSLGSSVKDHYVYDGREETGQWDEIMIILFKK
jgi:hypothetical protein